VFSAFSPVFNFLVLSDSGRLKSSFFRFSAIGVLFFMSPRELFNPPNEESLSVFLETVSNILFATLLPLDLSLIIKVQTLINK
jgi:hypothetical protein